MPVCVDMEIISPNTVNVKILGTPILTTISKRDASTLTQPNKKAILLLVAPHSLCRIMPKLTHFRCGIKSSNW